MGTAQVVPRFDASTRYAPRAAHCCPLFSPKCPDTLQPPSPPSAMDLFAHSPNSDQSEKLNVIPSYSTLTSLLVWDYRRCFAFLSSSTTALSPTRTPPEKISYLNHWDWLLAFS